ncbi:MAG: manganese efflux pump MntP family protein [bacterium]
MSILTMIFIGAGLGADAFAVSITAGISGSDMRKRNSLKLGLLFGIFQAVMPLIGYSLAYTVVETVNSWGPYFAFLILVLLGIKMIHQSMTEEKAAININSFLILTGLAIATSIDAFMTGVSLGLLRVSIILPVIIIGAVTALMCIAGFLVGRRITRSIGHYAERAGGLVLILIGVKILIENIVN